MEISIILKRLFYCSFCSSEVSNKLFSSQHRISWEFQCDNYCLSSLKMILCMQSWCPTAIHGVLLWFECVDEGCAAMPHWNVFSGLSLGGQVSAPLACGQWLLLLWYPLSWRKLMSEVSEVPLEWTPHWINTVHMEPLKQSATRSSHMREMHSETVVHLAQTCPDFFRRNIAAHQRKYSFFAKKLPKKTFFSCQHWILHAGFYPFITSKCNYWQVCRVNYRKIYCI